MSTSERSAIRLIASDLDGTLLRSDQRISERTFEVFAQARALGITVVAATGRGPMALPAFEPNGVIEMAVCSNGAAVVDLLTGQIVERSELEGAAAAVIFDDVRNAIPEATFAWDSAVGFGWEEAFTPHGQILIDSYGGKGRVDFDSAAPVGKAFVAHDELGYAQLAERVKNVISVEAEVSSAGLPFVVITAPDVTKANALDRLCQRKGIDPSQVVAFGDSWNDLDMLSWAGIGVAMENANEDVKEAANDVAGSHDHDGVAEYLVELLGLPAT